MTDQRPADGDTPGDLPPESERSSTPPTSDAADDAETVSSFGAGVDGRPARKRRPRRKKKATARSTAEAEAAPEAEASPSPSPSREEGEAGPEEPKGSEDAKGTKRRRRGSRGGRRRKRSEDSAAVAIDVIPGEDDDLGEPEIRGVDGDSADDASADGEASEGGTSEGGSKKKRRRRRSRRKSSKKDDDGDEAPAEDAPEDDEASEDDEAPSGKKKRKRSRSKKKASTRAPSKTAEEKAAEAEALRTQTIAVNAAEPEERRIAVFEDDVILDFMMNAESQKTLVNDIYRGRVVNLEPAIGAAFIDFGQGRNGFLHTSDVMPIYGEKGFQLEDLLTAGHHDVEGDHDADWSEEADALEDDASEDSPDDAASDGDEPAAEDDADPQDGDDDGDSGESDEPRGRRTLRSRSRRAASPMIAVLGDGDDDASAPADEQSGDEPPSGGTRKKRKRSRKKKASTAKGSDSAEGDGERKSSKSSKKSAKKAGKKSAKKSSKKSSKKGRSKATAKSRGSRARGRGERRTPRERRPIDQLLKVGDPVVVQVTKDAIGDKGPTLTTYISMPGRYLVLMPSMSRTGVSRKIPDEKERKRLKRILASLDTPNDMGVIVRTAGVGRTKADLQRDLDYLLGLWESFGNKLKSSRGPAPLYLESDVATRTLRDLFNRRTKEVLVDDHAVHEQMVGFADQLMPEHVERIKRYEGDRPLFQHCGIEQDFERIFARRVDLPSGGSIVFDQAEALVAIDVNSGRTRTDSYDFEDIALKTNLEAVPEIARQIKLRDLGGIIVCDFIDMTRSASNRQVERALRTALSDDRARSKLGRISQFGLLEMTRQRLGPGTHKKVFQTCPRCRGTGRIRTVESRAQAILRRLGGAVIQKGFSKVEVRAHPEVIAYLKEDLWDWVRALEHRSEKEIELTSVPDQAEDSVLRYLRADGREVRPGGRRKR
ncbi:MAG: Rne/Rng family ribonuclease [Planctomycetota bacterium]